MVIISARQEWQAVIDRLRPTTLCRTPFGEWFEAHMRGHRPVFLQGGWGKVNAAASAQFAIDTWKPDLLVNLGTCGGFAGKIEKGAIILAERTVIYDIYEKMSDPENAIRYYSTDIDLDWMQGREALPVQRGVLVSGDRDLHPAELPELFEKYGAAAGDWESGAIAYTARRNGVPCLILRAVSDLVGEQGSPAYGNIDHFIQEAGEIMKRLLDSLPDWLDIWAGSSSKPAHI